MYTQVSKSSTYLRLDYRRFLLTLCLCAGFGLFGIAEVSALGTAAGTNIQNQASATFQSGGTTVNINSNTTSHTVNEVIDVVVTAQTPTVSAATPSTGQATRFRVTNTGNGTETFSLTLDLAIGGDDFDPSADAIYIDDGDGIFEPGTDDVLYTAGANDPVLNANILALSFVEIWVSVDIPGVLANGDIGIVDLLAESTNPGAAGAVTGTVLAGQGDSGTDAIVGTSNADSNDQASYTVTTINLTVNKTAVVVDPYGGTAVVPGATITYTLDVQLTGTGTANNLIITDNIPAQTTYNTSTIVVDAVPKGDLGSDGDNADYNVSSPNVVTVNLGNVVAPATHSISFTVTVQ